MFCLPLQTWRWLTGREVDREVASGVKAIASGRLWQSRVLSAEAKRRDAH